MFPQLLPFETQTQTQNTNTNTNTNTKQQHTFYLTLS